ncbi:MAG: molybdopterin molybdotransferase MoeA [Terricaulis sp.]
MLSVTEARAAMLGCVDALAGEDVALEHCLGRVLATPLVAARDQPPFIASAMDGYALAQPKQGAPYVLVGEAAAGRAFERALAPGEAIRISTGAPAPEGTVSILIQEEASFEDGRLLRAQTNPGRHLRPRAGDFAAGATLLERGRLLDPIAMALAASSGTATLNVIKRPRAIAFAGGDEIMAPGVTVRDDQVYESGSFAVCGLGERWGAHATRGVSLADTEDAIARAVEDAWPKCDLLILIGGASVGPHDHTRSALARLGARVVVDKVAVQPGKPTWFAVTPEGCVLGLPGNPASAIVCAYLFARPLIEAMLGRDPMACVRPATAPLGSPLGKNGARETYLRARIGEDGRLTPFENQDSSLLTVFARANALTIRAPFAEPSAAGDLASYLPLA